MYPDNQRDVMLFCSSPSIDNEEKIQINKFELKTNEYLIIMWSTFLHYEIKGPIEVGAKITKLIEDILKMLKRPKPSLNDEM